MACHRFPVRSLCRTATIGGNQHAAKIVQRLAVRRLSFQHLQVLIDGLHEAPELSQKLSSLGKAHVPEIGFELVFEFCVFDLPQLRFPFRSRPDLRTFVPRCDREKSQPAPKNQRHVNQPVNFHLAGSVIYDRHARIASRPSIVAFVEGATLPPTLASRLQSARSHDPGSFAR